MMFTNLSFIVRRFFRQKFTTTLHVIGLTLGITVCLLIGLFVKYELSFDGYQPKANRTYRVNQVWVDFGNKTFHYSTPFPLAAQIRKDVPGLEQVTQVHSPYQSIIEINPEKRFKQERVIMTDADFLDVFDVKVIEGNGYETLRKPYRALLTESTAKKFYGNEDPLGKTFIFNDSFPVTVGGVIKDFPANTHLPATMLLSFSENGNYLMTSTTQYGFVSGGSTFIVLPEGTTPNSGLNKSLQSIYDRLVNNQPWMGKNSRVEMELQPLTNVHFNTKYAGGGQWVQAINSKWLWFFAFVGIAVLTLACINFINLSTAQSITRAKEIGVRKSVGAGKAHLMLQFLSEALLLVIVSTAAAILISKFSLPYINSFTDKKLTLDIVNSPWLFVWMFTGILLTALMAGIYPAWVITRFQPANTLKSGSVIMNPQSSFFRKALVVAQFSISVCLLMGLLLIGRQMNYMRSKNLGFEKDNILMMPLPVNLNKNSAELLSNELRSVKGIKGWSFSTSAPSGGENTHWGTHMSLTGPEDPNRKSVTAILTDEQFPKFYGLHLLAGRFFNASDTLSTSETLPAGSRFCKMVVNEKLIQELGFGSPDSALGKKFWIGMNDWKAEIVGVVANFNTGSLHEKIQPTMIGQSISSCDKTGIKIVAGADIPATISEIGAIYKKVFPKGIFEFSFLDQTLDALYKNEARLYNLFRIFSLLAMLISCLGLWGLITFAAHQRVKEIGIRKVLGASVTSIVSLLTRDFVLLVSIAIAIATPLAYWGIGKWLQDFAFRINIGWSVFVIAGVTAIAIALVTVVIQALKAAIANPVNSLRNE